MPARVHQVPVGISIHAPREGSDTEAVPPLLMVSDFNPRSP